MAKKNEAILKSSKEIKITEIKSLSNKNKAITIKEYKDELEKFNKYEGKFHNTIEIDNAAEALWKNFEEKDNIQVTWSEGEGENKKTKYRAVGGTINKKGNKIEISGLKDVSKFSIGFNGKIAIGPEGGDADAALLSVRIDDFVTEENPKGDSIINFSDTTGGTEGSEINLKVLLEWIKGKTGDQSVELPSIPGDKEPKDFIIEFKKFYFNMTQKTFDFNIQSKEGKEITIGDFTIKKVGFRVTNVPVLPEPKTPSIKS
ncbi:hypothetical protein ATE84_2616 [Aquimarina sp. MAR_2010_214]|uniref:hypothetical protein n=1 Tax=Aquimarina sp. MAR_2010_214 TaxID=1250026 RepID=UPI000C70B811|nr:hypothetical protein [Aquimarina sp. MAR_2010_214]PKV50557.1 hypothetical protein ATE84_2616 [Aquimarina sp. MAR_2010_214]